MLVIEGRINDALPHSMLMWRIAASTVKEQDNDFQLQFNQAKLMLIYDNCVQSGINLFLNTSID